MRNTVKLFADLAIHVDRTMPKLLPSTNLQAVVEEAIAARGKAITVGVESEAANLELEFHSHEKSQLMLSLRGVGTCEAEGGIWLVPPLSAVFVPAGVMHRVSAAGKIEGYAVFIDPDEYPALPSRCTTMVVNPLLRELIIRSAQFASNYEPGGVESRVTALMLDEICTAPAGDLHLPMPSDPRLRKIFEGLMANPADRGTVKSWGRRVGMSERSLARIIASETGMSFGRWRQQLNIVLALQWMAGGSTVQKVAFDLGYENVGSFVTMFGKAMGTSPARFMAERCSNH